MTATTVQKFLDVNRMEQLEVEGFTYRTATVGQRFLQLPRDMMQGFEEKLAELAGWHLRDNHTAFRLTDKYGHDKQTVYVSFSDQTVAFGLAIRQERW